MKHFVRCACIAFAAGLIAALGLSQEKSAKPDAEMEAMMKKVEAASTPGAAHKALEPFVGEWNAEVKMWMAPGAPPTVSKGTSKASWVMNGRFLKEEFHGEFMGKPFRGLAFTGYDNVRQKYSSLWIDDMSTTMFTSEGSADASGKVFSYGGTYSCPMTGEKHKIAHQVHRIINPDKHVFEMHDPTLGPNSKTMEITYTRK